MAPVTLVAARLKAVLGEHRRTKQMPLGEIAGEVLGGLFRFLAHLLVEIVLEILIKGPGYIICRPFSKNVDPDGFMAVVVGLVFWAVVGGCGYVVYKFSLA